MKYGANYQLHFWNDTTILYHDDDASGIQPIPTLEESANSHSVPVSDPIALSPRSGRKLLCSHSLQRQNNDPCHQEALTDDRPPLKDFRDGSSEGE